MATMLPRQAPSDYESQKLDEALRLSEIPLGNAQIPAGARRIGLGDAAADGDSPPTFRIPGRPWSRRYNTAAAWVVALLLGALMFVVVVLTLYL